MTERRTPRSKKKEEEKKMFTRYPNMKVDVAGEDGITNAACGHRIPAFKAFFIVDAPGMPNVAERISVSSRQPDGTRAIKYVKFLCGCCAIEQMRLRENTFRRETQEARDRARLEIAAEQEQKMTKTFGGKMLADPIAELQAFMHASGRLSPS